MVQVFLLLTHRTVLLICLNKRSFHRPLDTDRGRKRLGAGQGAGYVNRKSYVNRVGPSQPTDISTITSSSEGFLPLEAHFQGHN